MALENERQKMLYNFLLFIYFRVIIRVIAS